MAKNQRIMGIFIYSLAAFFLLYEMALQVSPSVMTAELMHDFTIDALKLGVMASFYFYSYSLMQIPVGVLFDRFSSRIVITLAVLMCSLGALFFGLTQDVAYASLGRFLMGIGSAFAFVAVLISASRWFSPYYFAFLVGIAQFLAALGALCGEVILAIIITDFGWRVTIISLGILGIFLTLLCLLFFRDHPLKKSGEHPHHRLHFFQSFLEVFRSKQTWWIALYAFSSWGPIAVFAALWGVPYLMVKYGISNILASGASAMIWIGIGVVSPILGWVSNKVGKRVPLLWVCSAIGFISSIFILYIGKIPFWLDFVFLLGMGIAGAGQILSFALVKDNNHTSVLATAIGVNNMAVVIGGALLQPFVGWLLHCFWNGKMEKEIPVYLVENYQMALLVVPICFLIGIIVSCFFIKETYCRPHHVDQLL